jgi:hypothetical protein
MPFLDAQLLLSNAQAITADAASTNTIDLGNVTPKNQIGDGEPMALVIVVNVAADATAGDETYEFQLIQSANADLSSPDILAKTDTSFITSATLVADYKLVIPVPPGGPTKRYLGAYYNVGGTTPTITVTSFLQPLSMVEKTKVYANGYSIS